ncbi:Uncharacterised protein [Listeria grayi]|uniref:Uncharacterized protein n=1 Tax=Listeria grayi TaxID=1641 RepID=A0A378MBZ5_LISGR|nr:hypothetical protein [Listeria grayi]STY42832.1 Uncharacterised protein [Listeria grayi]
MQKEYQYVIVGGGMVADYAARGIREHDKEGSIGIFPQIRMNLIRVRL